MKADSISVQDFFQAERRHLVPLYQRPYVWNREEQWEPLWEDLHALTELALDGHSIKPHFLGAIVLEQTKYSIHDLPTRVVIDGQQRLTTLQLLMASVRDLCNSLEDETITRRLDRLTRNENAKPNSDQRFKVLPTNLDRPAFRELMTVEQHLDTEHRLEAAQASSVGHKLLAGAYAYFHRTVGAWLQEKGAAAVDQRAATLVSVLCQGMSLVAIDLDSEDDAQVIFETLNARGAPLLPADLIKNYLFHTAALEGADLDTLYHELWKPFDEDADYWRLEVKQGRLSRPVVDIFLRHYLSFASRDEVSMPHLFSEFKSFTAEKKRKAEEHLREVQEFAGIYRGFGHFDPGTRRGQFFNRLQVMETSTLIPFLLGLFQRFGQQKGESQAAIDTILVDLESFLVRRMICRLVTKDYNHLFLDMIGALDRAVTAQEAASEVRRFLLEQTADSRFWPDDSAFEASWLEIPAYKAFNRPRLRMLLTALEDSYWTDFSERIILTGKLTVEHLLPQVWEDTWPLPEGIPATAAIEARSSRLHRFGNLTLLTKKLNPAVSNGAWGSKHPKILKHSALALNRQLQGQAAWDESTIDARTAELFRMALKIWPRPKESQE